MTTDKVENLFLRMNSDKINNEQVKIKAIKKAMQMNESLKLLSKFISLYVSCSLI